MTRFRRPRLVVAASSTLDVVQFAGGWLFDRVASGWDVTVLTGDGADSRPLRILGARSIAPESTLGSSVRRSRPQAVALEAGLYGSDARVRRMVHEVLDDDADGVRLWGGCWPADLDSEAEPVRHRLSVAASAFKAQALVAAAAAVDAVGETETFRSARPRETPRARSRTRGASRSFSQPHV